MKQNGEPAMYQPYPSGTQLPEVPIAGAVRLWGLITWLAGLVAVILLWQRPSTTYFKGITA
jgi:hypothetical protein